ncbi:12763_t:CDS:2, partial [Acaulospora colombiana]
MESSYPISRCRRRSRPDFIDKDNPRRENYTIKDSAVNPKGWCHPVSRISIPPTRSETSTSYHKKQDSRMVKHNNQRKKSTVAVRASPLERPPTELLSQIVTIYLSQTNSITTIMQICCRIRQVIAGMASIWRWIMLLGADGESGFGARQRTNSLSYLNTRKVVHSIFACNGLPTR